MPEASARRSTTTSVCDSHDGISSHVRLGHVVDRVILEDAERPA
jgi:hypothetical protein